jgi:PAB1-binding protein PBP1
MLDTISPPAAQLAGPDPEHEIPPSNRLSVLVPGRAGWTSDQPEPLNTAISACTVAGGVRYPPKPTQKFDAPQDTPLMPSEGVRAEPRGSRKPPFFHVPFVSVATKYVIAVVP